MFVSLELTTEPIERPQPWVVPLGEEIGALVEFFGIVRRTEGETAISALTYEAYDSMAEKVMRAKIEALEKKYPCQGIRVVHRLGRVAAGESAIYVGIQSRHRGEGFLFLQEFMDELKRDVPIWKQVA